ADLARPAPGIELRAAQLHAPPRTRIFPGPDRGSMQFGQMTKRAGPPAQVARQRAHVVPAAADDAQPAAPGQVVGQETGLVQVDPRRWKINDFATLCLEVRPLAADPLVAVRGRDLIAPAGKFR